MQCGKGILCIVEEYSREIDLGKVAARAPEVRQPVWALLVTKWVIPPSSPAGDPSSCELVDLAKDRIPIVRKGRFSGRIRFGQ